MDLRGAGFEDSLVYEIAVSTGRILVTRNIKDFRLLIGSKNDYGLIAVPPHISVDQLDTSLTALLMRHGPKYFQGRIVHLVEQQESKKKEDI